MLRIISGKYKNFRLNLVPSQKTKSSTHLIRKALFDTIQKDIHNSIVLDLFAGSGAYGFEALSREAKKIFMVDNSLPAYLTIRKNQNKLKINNQQIIVFYKNYLNILKRFISQKIKFDVIILDPPYAFEIKNLFQKLFKIIHSRSWVIYETNHKNLLPDVDQKFILVKNKKYGSKRLVFYKPII
ncbi:MAG: 16S rRNA (guanine(966)-N(2))-methyltransferase RsmD [Candidatus Phytoplasma australasiaticum]|uniref:16S rRNA (Guanine(966)-N(2))-methyltransferase RsmD n=4 Tax=Candidatus Phytoplasma TaxID=33926 RepID=A0A9K3STJ7_9MOLU|nr:MULTISPECIES: 16S rRNA (guanine(966)-N(2))-methyltransferase RsmD [Phytoplasma]MDV3148358.1 16S rRNA (guanine(966)-N(2))-methyltransferase RsmD [Sweet potato little leaf phytoplasma]QLL36941.1 N6-adenine-specific methylase ['Echinacea purpurea' witches'-broom phytoplasma]WEX20343.1 MAG: 16S rRNA (guanine966-N2)-methyltransferase [Candidatus Phytoplasma aurantifolia]EMR14732.1 N6-adenine-specific methylase [Peanut witches'-broom phytoplasma NTU2011]MCG3566842.1 16S rRNA (guanine(966)-N(2))-m